VQEEYLRAKMADQGSLGQCSFCSDSGVVVIELEELAEFVHQAFESHFEWTSSEPEGIDLLAAREGDWIQPGVPVAEVIAEVLGADEEIGEAIRVLLSDTYGPVGRDALINDDPYDPEAQYQEREVQSYQFRDGWTSFCWEIENRARFFNESAKAALDELFEGIGSLRTRNGDSVILDLSPGDCLFRARTAETAADMKQIVKDLPISLGPPPGAVAEAGRMNADGIAIFYGATDVDTCINEIRPPVGSFVVCGKFELLRRLRLLDFTRLADVLIRGSLFDPQHVSALERAAFLRVFEEEISRPVIPGRESRMYLPTQVVAEYLASHPDVQIDGLVFTSSQKYLNLDRGGEGSEDFEEGKNVVLFKDSSRLAPSELPKNIDVSVSLHVSDPDEKWPFVWISELVLPEDDGEKYSGINPFDLIDANQDRAEDSREISVKLNLASVEVRKIVGVSYQSHGLDISRSRFERSELDDGSDF